jgi:hypothetical protein
MCGARFGIGPERGYGTAIPLLRSRLSAHDHGMMKSDSTGEDRPDTGDDGVPFLPSNPRQDDLTVGDDGVPFLPSNPQRDQQKVRRRPVERRLSAGLASSKATPAPARKSHRESDDPAPEVDQGTRDTRAAAVAEGRDPEEVPVDGFDPEVKDEGLPGGGDEFRVEEAHRDLDQSWDEVKEIIERLDNLDDEQKARVTEVTDELATLNRLLGVIAEFMAKGRPVPAGLAVSVTLRVEMARGATKDAADHADGELKKTLEQILGRLRWIGQKLLSMNLHLLPVKEWSLGGEVSALFVTGQISVTFGK